MSIAFDVRLRKHIIRSDQYLRITAEIFVRSLSNFIGNKWTDTGVIDLCDASRSKRVQLDNFSGVYLIIGHKFRHKIVKA